MTMRLYKCTISVVNKQSVWHCFHAIEYNIISFNKTNNYKYIMFIVKYIIIMYVM